MPIHSTQVVRIDGLMLAASVENSADDSGRVNALKTQQRSIMKGMTNNSAPRAAIDSGDFLLHYFRQDDIMFFAITERAFPKQLAQMYLDDISREFILNMGSKDYRSPSLRPYAFNDFDTFIQRTKKSYENPRASDNLSKLDQQLKETTQIMSKNLEDLLYRGDSLDKMGQMSSDLKESSKKYKRAAARINWELLMKQVSITPHEMFYSTPSVLIADSTVHLRPSRSSSSSSSSGASGKCVFNAPKLPPGLYDWQDIDNGRYWMPSSQGCLKPWDTCFVGYVGKPKEFQVPSQPVSDNEAGDIKIAKEEQLPPVYVKESAWITVQKTMRNDFKWPEKRFYRFQPAPRV